MIMGVKFVRTDYVGENSQSQPLLKPFNGAREYDSAEEQTRWAPRGTETRLSTPHGNIDFCFDQQKYDPKCLYS